MGPIYDAQATRVSLNRETVVPAFDSGLTSMVSDEVSRDHERSVSILLPSPEGRTLQAGGSEASSGDAPFTAPIGLGLGGLQPLSTRVSDYLIVVTRFAQCAALYFHNPTLGLSEYLILEGICLDLTVVYDVFFCSATLTRKFK